MFTIMEGAVYGGEIGSRIEDAVFGRQAVGAPTIGVLLSGFDPDTLIHLTPNTAADFSDGVKPDTFFARLGDVSQMTVSEYQENVVGGAAAAGPGQPVSGFVLAAPNSGTFYTGWYI